MNLTVSNVMYVLYLAKKYMVPLLADKCTEYLRDQLEASNVFSILPPAQKFEDKDLERRCWEVIEKHTEEAVTSDEFVTLERSLVESVVKRERLNVKEVELFKAVDRWATKESKRQELTPHGDVKRRILGEDIVKAVRFPLMSQKEFVSVVFDSDILTKKEIKGMIKYYNDVSLKSPLPFIQSPRMRSVHGSFAQCFPPSADRWHYNGLADALRVTVNKSVKLHGVQHFGSEGGKYTVSLQINDATSGFSLVSQSGSFSTEKDKVHAYHGFDVMFNHPVSLERDKTYEIVSLITGPHSWYGEKGATSVEFQAVQFTFSCSVASSNNTSETRGQFPSLLFSESCCSA